MYPLSRLRDGGRDHRHPGGHRFYRRHHRLLQHDIKNVLAFSTVSQIGYMVLGVGTGAYTAAAFPLVAHAFFKGLLFLGGALAIHGLEDEQDLKRMGALAAT